MKHFRHLIPLLLLCILLFFTMLDQRHLWDTDEGMHAEMAKEMVLSGDWITTKFNGEPNFDKPALYSWLVAISFLIFGFTELAARFPAAILGLGTVVITHALGRRLFGSPAGFLGAVVLATSLEFILLSRTVVHDMTLAFCVTLALYAFHVAWSDENRRGRSIILFHGACALGVLAKGPLGLGLPLLAAGLFLMFQRRPGFLLRFATPPGILVFLAIAAPWYILISIKNPGYLYDFFIEKNLGSIGSPQAVHQEAVYYYIPILAGGFLPWTVFLPLTLVHIFRRRRGTERPEMLFLLLWAGSMFLFFSVVRSKLPAYILPLFPALSLLVGVFWSDLMNREHLALRRWALRSYLPVVVLLAAGAIGLWFRPPVRLSIKYGVDPTLVNCLASLVAASLAVSFLLLRRQHFRTSFAVLVGMMAALVLLLDGVLLLEVDPYRSAKNMALRLDARLPPGEPIYFYRFINDSATFYTDRRGKLILGPEDLEKLLASERRAFCFVQEKHIDDLDHLKKPYHVVDREGNKLIISNRQ